jgi:transcriptional regulator with XRE-family HTH domain
MDREELARTLVAARGRVRPVDVGLAATANRRVPGLRRDEVARLAGISVDYLVRLEQGRGPTPSDQVLGALARALRLGDEQCGHLFVLAGSHPPRPGRIDRVVRVRTTRLLDRLTDVPVIVMDAMGGVLTWNDLALALLGDLTELAPHQRNVLRLRFLGAGGRVVYDSPDDEERSAVEAVADLRTTAARYPDDPDVCALVDELAAGSERFRQLWLSARFEAHRTSTKTFDHPEVGRLRLACDLLLLPDTDQRLIVYSAEPGTPDADALDLLRVVGVQHLGTAR